MTWFGWLGRGRQDRQAELAEVKEQQEAPIPGFEQVAEVLPERNRDGRYWWQGLAERLQDRLEGLPAPEGGGLFVGACLRAGARAVPVVRGNVLWERDAPDKWTEKLAHRVYELRIRLGLFYAASLRYLVQGVSRMRVTCGESEWKPVTEAGESFKDFAARQEGEVEVTWSKAAPDVGQACLVTQVFLSPEEALLLTPELAQEVYMHVCSAGPSGLFGLMLAADGQVEKTEVDVARVFLEALAQAVDRKVVGVNKAANGHVFVAPSFWFVTSPIGVRKVLEWLGQRRQGRRYDFSRREVMEALFSADCLVGAPDGAGGRAVRVCDIDATGIGSSKPLVLNGLAVKASKIPGIPDVKPLPEGVVTLRAT